MFAASSLASTGQFCTVTFVTKDGSLRTLNGRVGVTKYLKGEGNNRSVETAEKYVLIYTRNGSNKFDAPRNVDKSKIVAFKGKGLVLQKNNESVYPSFV